MRYNSVDDAISDYKQAYGLMWDKRSINVRFRRKRGNTCLPEEPKLDVKKVKEEPSNTAQVEKERNANHTELELNVNELKEEENNTDEIKEDKINHADKSSTNQNVDSMETRLQDNSNKAQRKPSSQVQENTNSHLAGLSTQEKQPWVIDIKSICCVVYCYITIVQIPTLSGKSKHILHLIFKIKQKWNHMMFCNHILWSFQRT